MRHTITRGMMAAGLLAFLGAGTSLSAQSTTRPTTRLARDTTCAQQASVLGTGRGVTDSAGINKSRSAPAPAAKGMTDSAGINKPTTSPTPLAASKGVTDSAGINKPAGSPPPAAKGMTDSAGINKPNGSMNPCREGLGAGAGMDSLGWPKARPDSASPTRKP